MKVLFLTNMFPTVDKPSYGCFVKTQFGSIRAMGIDLDLHVIRGDLSRLEYLKAYSLLARKIRLGRHDLIHAHFGLTAIPAVAQLSVPVVVSYCGEDLLGQMKSGGAVRRRSLLLAFVQRQVARLATRVIVKSQGMLDYLPRPSRNRATVIPNGVDFDMFRPPASETERAELRRRFGLRPGTCYALFPYDPNRIRKNAGLVEEALAIVRSRGRDAEPFYIFDQKPEVIASAMRAVDCLALPSYWEGSPNSVKEALASSLPIVAAPVGDVPEQIAGLEGCHMRPHDPAGFAEAFETVFRDGPRTQTRERVGHLRLESVAARVVSIYSEALALQSSQRPHGVAATMAAP